MEGLIDALVPIVGMVRCFWNAGIYRLDCVAFQ